MKAQEGEEGAEPPGTLQRARRCRCHHPGAEMGTERGTRGWQGWSLDPHTQPSSPGASVLSHLVQLEVPKAPSKPLRKPRRAQEEESHGCSLFLPARISTFFVFCTILSSLPTSIICSWRPLGLLAAAKQGFAFPKSCSSPLLGTAGHEAKSSQLPAGARSTSRGRAAAVGKF